MSNGCLEVVPGSQVAKIPLGDDRCITPKWVAAHEWIPVELKTGTSLLEFLIFKSWRKSLIRCVTVGEFLVFGSHLAHRSGPNNSEFGRAAIYATYVYTRFVE